MNIKTLIILLVLGISLSANEVKKIAVCIPAQNASDASVQSLVESARRYFCRLQDVHYFILSDTPTEMEGDDIEWLPMGAGKSLKGIQTLQGSKKLFEEYHYLFIIDPKMVFVAPVGNEVFGELIAVQKVSPNGKTPLYSSGFYGGKPNAVLDLLKSAYRQSESLSDEVLINRCFKEKPPTRILSPSYAYPENWELEYSKKIVESRG